MNFKKPFKVLTTAALIGSLSLSAVAPGSALAADQVKNTVNVKAESAYTPTKVILENDKGEKLSLSYDDYLTEVILSGATEAEQLKVLNGYTLSHFVTEAGTFDALTYLSALSNKADTDTLEDVLEGIKKAGEDVEEPKDYKEGSLTDGTLDPVDAEENFGVVEISAINATNANFTVTFDKEVKEADLKDAKIALKGTQDLTASFVKLDGKTATFKVDQDILNKAAYNGNYALSSSAIKFAEGAKTTYTATISTTKVEGFVFYADQKPAANVTVKVGTQTVKTDADGYYSAAASAGKVDVVVNPGEGYFLTKESVNVQRNFSSVVNATATPIVDANLQVTGDVIDKKTGDAVANSAVVTLEKEVDGEWIKVASVNSQAGKYTFANSGVSITDADSVNAADTDGKFKSAGTSFKYEDKLRVVISKDISKDNLADVYEAKTEAITLSDETSKTELLTELRPIEEIKNFDVNVDWADLEGEDNDADITGTEVEASLIAADGETILVDYTKIADKLATEKKLKEAAKTITEDFFGATATEPTIPTGTYYLKLKDNAASENAIAIIPVQVTEGKDVVVSGTIEKARTIDTTTKFGTFKYANAFNEATSTNLLVLTDNEEPTAPTASANVVEGQVKVYKKIGNVNVLVKEDIAEFKKVTVGTNDTVQAVNSLGQLTLGDYNVIVENPYIKGEKVETTATATTAERNTKDITVETASTLELTLTKKATPAGGAAITALEGKDVKVELLDEAGKVVSTSTETVENSKVTLDGVAPNVYKVRVTPTTAFKAGTTAKTVKVYDIQDQKASVELEAVQPSTISGYVKYDQGTKDVAAGDGTVMVYNQAGGAVQYYDLAGTGYEFTGLNVGETYKFVVRGKDFETTTKTVTIKEGQNEPLNIRVTTGGEGKAKYIVTDELKKEVDQAPHLTMTAYDSNFNGYISTNPKDPNAVLGYGYYDAKGNYVALTGNDQATVVSGAPDYVGTYEFAGNEKVWSTEEELSAGTYTVVVTDGETNYATHNDTFTLQDKNSDFDGPAIELKLLSSQLSSKITVNVEAATGSVLNNLADYIVVYDKETGKIVTVSNNITGIGTTGTATLTVPNNKTYSVAYFANGHFVTSKDVSVQDYDIDNVTLKADEASRN